MAKEAKCIACGEDILFDAYVDINGEVQCDFSDWVCSGCSNHGKHQNSGDGYEVSEVSEAEGRSE